MRDGPATCDHAKDLDHVIPGCACIECNHIRALMDVFFEIEGRTT